MAAICPDCFARTSFSVRKGCSEASPDFRGGISIRMVLAAYVGALIALQSGLPTLPARLVIGTSAAPTPDPVPARGRPSDRGQAGSHSHPRVLGLPPTCKEHLMATPTLSALNVVSNRERYGSVAGQPAPERALRLGK